MLWLTTSPVPLCHLSMHSPVDLALLSPIF